MRISWRYLNDLVESPTFVSLHTEAAVVPDAWGKKAPTIAEVMSAPFSAWPFPLSHLFRPLLLVDLTVW